MRASGRSQLETSSHITQITRSVLVVPLRPLAVHLTSNDELRTLEDDSKAETDTYLWTTIQERLLDLQVSPPASAWTQLVV
jgi:hypothetical protein